MTFRAYYVKTDVFVSSLGPERAVLQRCGRILAMASSDPRSDERDVFSGLPNTRPQRRSAKRDRGDKGETADGGEQRPGAKAAPPQARAAASSTPSAARGQARAKAAAKPQSPPVPPVPPAGYATPDDDDRPHGTDLIGTAVQAAGELAHIGIVFGAKALKSAIQRLPRP